MSEISDIEKGARWHHERYDGKGYPDGLKGEEIPEYARIICVADAYDAMTSKRSYRDSMPQAKVRDEIKKGRGSQFDPKIADVFLTIMDEDTEYRLREGA
jgi:putative two-component system response regulator